MKLLVVLFSLTCLAACSATDQLTDITLPTLLEQQPLPPIPVEMTGPQVQLDFELLVAKDGSVLEARLLSGSGDAEWDSAVLLSMRKWKYTPAYYKDKPLKLWLRQSAIVRFVETRCLCLAEISCGSMADADSAYTMLSGGSEFGEVVQRYSIGSTKESGGELGQVSIQQYPKDIQKMLEGLKAGEYTKPVKYNDQYVIFKKLKH